MKIKAAVVEINWVSLVSDNGPNLLEANERFSVKAFLTT